MNKKTESIYLNGFLSFTHNTNNREKKKRKKKEKFLRSPKEEIDWENLDGSRTRISSVWPMRCDRSRALVVEPNPLFIPISLPSPSSRGCRRHLPRPRRRLVFGIATLIIVRSEIWDSRWSWHNSKHCVRGYIIRRTRWNVLTRRTHWNASPWTLNTFPNANTFLIMPWHPMHWCWLVPVCWNKSLNIALPWSFALIYVLLFLFISLFGDSKFWNS